VAAIRPARQHQGRAARLRTAAAGAGAVLLLVGTTAPRAQAPIIPEPAQSILLRDVGFTQGQLVLARHGRIVVKLLPTPQPKEVAVAGVTRIAVTKEQFFARYRDIERFKQHEAVKQLGRFSQPPDIADLAALTFSVDMLDDLRTCRPGDCKVKLSETWMTKLRGQVNWSSQTARADAQDLFRALLTAYVAEFQVNGASALVEYRDKDVPVRLGEQSTALIQRSPYLTALSPGFARYLTAYPRIQMPVLDSFIYWSQEQFGLKPVVSISHVSVYQDPAQPSVMIGASRQLYATHYFEASLGLTFAMDDGDLARPGIYLIYVNRTRADALTGAFGRMRRSVVHSRTTDGVEETLAALKRKLEGGER
jgi:hypothetical protein